ncbi:MULTISPECIES: GyrI-like domain-containing protein [Bacteria]|uniref:GyrI-like domain-containing protein n=1 Tax=Bacteria TaxID=2 RepID=UPI003C7C1359
MSVFSEEPFGAADPLDLAPVPLAAVRYHSLHLADLGTVFDPSYAALGQTIGNGAVAPSGPAVAIFRGDPQEVFDLDVAFPIETPLTAPIAVGDVAVEPAELPSGPALARTVIGSYDGLGAAWAELFAAAAVQGRRPAGVWIEVYVSDPRTTAVEELRTDLILPVMR